MKNRVRRGFTLPEVLVTVTVVAVLAAVVVPAVTQYVNKGDTPVFQQDLSEIRNAVTAYIADNRSFPAEFYDLTAAGNSGGKIYFAGSVTGTSTAVASFTSAGGITLGPAITSANGYLTTPLAFSTGASATCNDIYQLDKTIDGTVDGTNGNVLYDGTTCTGAASTNSTAIGSTVITLRLAATGT
ncbi:MAG TPA: prepilin-type N-terminal cleavage/methylation domain-containing protein [Gemmatimonadaceae bacterium]|nr:prepilin-type N-terminal cleavage/methylation domain-containing protein [Gemmatimonadaceae bacterium]